MNTYFHVTPDVQQKSSDRFERALKKLHEVKAYRQMTKNTAQLLDRTRVLR